MITRKVEKALNGQVNKEMYSAYLYMAMSAYSDTIGLKGFANWLMVQYHEEMLHAMKIYEYITRQGGKVKLAAIAEPPVEYGTPLAMFKKVLEHEKFVTKSINDLVNLAVAQKDHATHIFLQWYVTEQVEEEANAMTVMQKIKMVQGSSAMIMLDNELAARTYTPPAPNSET